MNDFFSFIFGYDCENFTESGQDMTRVIVRLT